MLLLSFGGKIAEKPNFGNYFIMLGVFWSSLHPFACPNFSKSRDKCPLRRFLLQVHRFAMYLLSSLCISYEKNKKFACMSLFYVIILGDFSNFDKKNWIFAG
jgi:hypothetical protein